MPGIQLQKEELTSVFLAITWWGSAGILHRGDRIAEPAHNPLAPTKPHWSNPVWASDVPAFISDWQTLTARHAFILPRAAGEGGIPHRAMTEGVRRISDCIAIARRTTSPLLDSS